MKKLILSLIIVATLLSPFAVSAQSVPPTQEELTQQLITLLTEMINRLQQQIADILASNAALTSTMQAQQVALNQIAQNTAPTVTTTIPETDLVVSCSGILGDKTIDWTALASGGNGSYKYAFAPEGCHALMHPDGTATNVLEDNNGSGQNACLFKDTNKFSYSGICNTMYCTLNPNMQMTVFIKSGKQIKYASCLAD